MMAVYAITLAAWYDLPRSRMRMHVTGVRRVQMRRLSRVERQRAHARGEAWINEMLQVTT